MIKLYWIYILLNELTMIAIYIYIYIYIYILYTHTTGERVVLAYISYEYVTMRAPHICVRAREFCTYKFEDNKFEYIVTV